jgi:putative membrane protein
MFFILRVLLNALVIFILAQNIPGIHVNNFFSALFFSVILGVINAVLRPLFLILTLPINVLTLGFFTLVVNAFTFWIASIISFGVHIETVAAAFWCSIIVGLVSVFMNLSKIKRR